MLRIYKKNKGDKKFKRLKSIQSLVWLSLVDASEQELKLLSSNLNISVETLRDSLDINELPRLKIENKNVVLLLRMVELVNSTYITTPITVIINPNNIVTITKNENCIIADIINEQINVSATQKSNFMINICLRVIYYYQEYINAISRQVKLTQKNIKQINKNDIISLITIEEILNSFVDALSRNIIIINKLLTQKFIPLYAQDKLLINDLVVDGEQVLELCKTHLKTISNIRVGYTTVLSMRLNKIMEILTYIKIGRASCRERV